MSWTYLFIHQKIPLQLLSSMVKFTTNYWFNSELIIKTFLCHLSSECFLLKSAILLNLIIYCTFSGEISLFEYTNEANQLQKKLLIHKGAIRSIGFDADGKNLYSGGKDKTIKITDVVKLKGLIIKNFMWSLPFSKPAFIGNIPNSGKIC